MVSAKRADEGMAKWNSMNNNSSNSNIITIAHCRQLS